MSARITPQRRLLATAAETSQQQCKPIPIRTIGHTTKLTSNTPRLSRRNTPEDDEDQSGNERSHVHELTSTCPIPTDVSSSMVTGRARYIELGLELWSHTSLVLSEQVDLTERRRTGGDDVDVGGHPDPQLTHADARLDAQRPFGDIEFR